MKNKKKSEKKEKPKSQKKKYVFGSEEDDSDASSLDRSVAGDSIASDVVENFVESRGFPDM